MSFFRTHFTKHHFFHAPHKWFLALLSSPIHFAVEHYKTRYHMKYVHAQKLFVFDMLLLLSTIVIAAAGIFWYQYDPSVTEQISLTLTPTTHTMPGVLEKIRSGEHVTYNIRYENNSETTLQNPVLTIQVPRTFLFDAENTTFTDTTSSIPLDALAPGERGELSFSGIFYGEPESPIHVGAQLSYTQTHRKTPEMKLSRIITTLRGSVLDISIDAPEKIVQRGQVPISIRVENPYHHAVPHVQIPLQVGEFFTIDVVSSTTGTTTDDTWILDRVEPETVHVLDGMLRADIPADRSRVDVSLLPLLFVRDEPVPQTPLAPQHAFDVVHPALRMDAGWSDGGRVQPGEQPTLTLTLTNTGDAPLNNLHVSLPIPSAIVNVNALLQQNIAGYNNGTLTINDTHNAALRTLAPGESGAVQITIPIRYAPQGGTDLTLRLSPRVTAGVASAGAASYEQRIDTPALAIGTQLLMQANSRYYTDEGDQLGRGPLPPTVGKESKFWAVVELKNTTSELENLRFSAVLPAAVSWTGKTSVSHGQNVRYNANTRRVSWSTHSLAPHAHAGVYIELALTPSAAMRGTFPPLLDDIVVRATDTHTAADIVRSSDTLTTRLTGDAVAADRVGVVE